MKRVLIIFLAIFIHAASYSQNDHRIIETINQSTASISTLECDFIQTNHLKMLSDVVVSNGKMYYAGGNKLHWQYLSPYTYTFILNDNQVLLKKNDHQDVIDVNQNKMFREIARIMMNSVLGKSISDDKSFSTIISDKGATYEAVMTPVKKDMAQIFPSLTLSYDKKQGIITKVILNQKNGDYTEISLKNIKKNVKIADEVFAIE